jgi:hypothetical protein
MLSDTQILAYIGAELSQGSGGNENDFIDANRQAALGTYLGQPDGKEVEGRSTVVSTDVADAIEWIMPEIVKAFTQNNEVVTFDAVGPNDDDQAELESQYVYDILMKDNKGFIVLHQFIKDALMQKNGFIKVFYSNDTKTSTESYTGITDEAIDIILADPKVELTEITTEQVESPQGPISLSDIKVTISIDKSKVEVVSVPPEEFRINKQHNSVDVSTARFSAHVYIKYAGDLINEGYDKELIDSIPTCTNSDDRDYRFYLQNETVSSDGDESLDPSLRPIEIAECYMYMDMDEDGIAEFVKVEVAGGDNPDVVLSIEEIDENPFISATAILMSHKLFGISIYDRLKQIQEQKTTLWRNIFDNMYLQNNQRTVVVENQVNLDDLMVSRPGGIIRAKRLDAVAPYVTPPLGGDAYQMMDYLDQVRAGRSGASPDGPVSENMIGDRVGSEGIASLIGKKEELVGLMIRVFAETGIKPLCYMIRNQVIRHQDVVKDYAFRGMWVKVDPRQWRERSHTTVRVGTGSGNRKEQMSALSQIMALQEKIAAQPGQSLVTENEVYNSANDFAKFAGMSGVQKYLLDPKSPQGQENKKKVTESSQESQKQQQEMEKVNLEATRKIADAEEQKAKVAGMNVQLKGELDSVKNETTAIIAALKQKLEQAKLKAESKTKGEELQYKYWDSGKKHEIARSQIAAQKKMAANNNNQQSKDDDK